MHAGTPLRIPSPAQSRNTPNRRAFGSLILAAVALVAAPGNQAFAQEGDGLSRAMDSFQFREIGPAVMGGRVAAIAVHESNPSEWYVGFATGGVWRTPNHGMSWEPLFDEQPTSSIGAVALAPSNPNVIWVGTGEPQNRQSSPYGGGVFRSVDRGHTWTDLGLTETLHVSRIVVHPRDPDVAYVAAVGHLFGPNPERGVYRTTDGGRSWEHVLFIDENTGAIDMVMDPGDPMTLFVTMYQRRRTAFGFSASGGGSGLYRTLDGGDSWHELTEGLPTGDLGRMGIDVYRQDGNLLYLTVEGENDRERGLYRSMDRGESWERVSERNTRPMYFSLVRIDPNNPERIYVGGVDLGVSDDGGQNWWQYEGYTEIHVDYHALWVDPANSDHVIVGNDGGVASSWDGAKQWRHHNNLAVGQFYEIGVDMRDPYYVCGGLQDNSSWCAPSNRLNEYGIANGDWTDVSGGDGFYNQIDPTDWRWVYTESQGGNLSRFNAETGESARIRPVLRTDGTEDEDAPDAYEFNWNAPVVVSQHRTGTIYMGANHLLRSPDRGQTWEEASPDLTAMIDRDSLEIFGRPLSEPHVSRNDGISRYGTITTVDESPLSADVLWVGTDDGQVQVTQDAGATWSNVTDNVPDLPGRRYVTRIEASAHQQGRAYVTMDGHWDDDYSAYVFVTENFGEDWQSITHGLPSHSVNVVREHPGQEKLLFVGNEVGVYASVDRGERWYRLKGNRPTAPVDDMVIHPRDNDLVVGTHGRSIWILDDLGALEDMATGPVAEDAGALFPIRRATLWSRSGGWPFWGDLFFGDNPQDGAIVRFHLPQELEADSVTLTVTDGSGAPVRTERLAAESGMREWVWDLRYDAPEIPEGGGGGGRFGGTPSGPTVLPGEYGVTLDAGGVPAERSVVVRVDPRVETTPAALAARQAALMDAHALATPVGQVRARIRDLESLMEEAEELLDGHADATEALEEQLEALTEALEALDEHLDDVNAATRMSGAVSGTFGTPTSDQLYVLNRGWEAVRPLVEGLNDLVEDQVPAFYAELDRLGIRPDPGERVEVPRRPGG